MKLYEDDVANSMGDQAFAEELLQIQVWYNQEKKRLDDTLAKKRSDAAIKFQQRALTKTATPKTQGAKPTGTVDTAGNPVTPQGTPVTPTVESLLSVKPRFLKESIYNLKNVEPNDLDDLKDYMDAENISYIEDEDGSTIDFDETELDKEWNDQLPKMGLGYVANFDDGDEILSIKDEDEDDIVDIDKNIDSKKVFYVKIDDEGAAFIGKIYKLEDNGEWESKLIKGESETFEKLNYDSEWDEFDIIAFLRENYADAQLIDEDEFNDHVEESYHERQTIPTLEEFMKNKK